MDYAGIISDMTFMLQKEVVDRMVAKPSTPAYGRLSVMLQRRFHMEGLLDVPPEAFDPPPKVESAVVRMIPKRQARSLRSTKPCFRASWPPRFRNAARRSGIRSAV